MERLLISGVDDVVGGNLALALADRFDVVGLWQHQRVELEGCRTVACDATELATAVQGESPRWVIHCGPLAVSSWSSDVPAAGLEHEPQVVATLVEAAERVGSTLTVISTDAVFAGPGMFHEEAQPRSGIGPLAEAARQVEDLLAAAPALVVRTHAFGFSPRPHTADFAEHIWRAVGTGGLVEADADRHATPILATDLAELLLLAHERGLQGVCHLCGAERTSPARFAVEAAAVLGISCKLARTLRPIGLAPAGPSPETSLNNRRARRELGVALPLLREGLARFAEQDTNGHRARLGASAPANVLLPAA